MSDALKPFTLDFSNRVIEHLGIKLYQNKPTNVIAEFVSNCWDADAKNVAVDIRASSSGTPEVFIVDDGRGMTRDELTDEFLVIGRDRRADSTAVTDGGRLPMGRKGIGKLAGFGIAGTIDVISVPNSLVRGTPVPQSAFWLRFDLGSVVAANKGAGPSGYAPLVLADGLSLDELEVVAADQGASDLLAEFLTRCNAGSGGVAIFLRDTSLKKAINPDAILRSLGSRFTVTLLRPDFVVKVNGKPVNAKDAFPPFQDFGFGTYEAPITESLSINGVNRSVKYWARFVALSDIDWSIENSGVGVYAHGKIAQDRPFFFGVKGKEILSRYLYAVVEADWLDELPEDVVSTDRRSINWDTDDTSELYRWGAAKLAGWVESFRKWKAETPREEIKKRIRALSPGSSLSGAEEDALASLLGDVLIGFGNDDVAKDQAISRFTDAWTHEPTRRLTKDLWTEIFANNPDTQIFPGLIKRLRDSLVPEAMGLAVTVSQRVAAITAMRRMIEKDETETHLQRLVELFPWLLGPQWERLTANQTIRTLVTSKHKPDPTAGGWALPVSKGALKPDFVFLSDVGEQSEIVVFELKGPECGKSLQFSEYQQLREYLDIIRQVYTQREIKVRGVLVGHDKGGFEESDNRIEVVTWSAVLASARSMHVSYLGALLKASEPGATDARLKQIADFGGQETLELLNRLAVIGDFEPVVMTALTSP